MNPLRLVLPFATFLIVTLAAQTAEAALALSFQRTDVSCNQGNNGRLAVFVTGGSGQYAYSWSPTGGNGSEATGLRAGGYLVTVKDLSTNEVIQSDSQYILQPSAVTFSLSQTNLACFGGSNGVASVHPSGGTAPYTFSWAPSGQTTAAITGLSAGSYSVTVTDNNGCQAARSFAITQPSAPLQAAIRTIREVSCNGGSNASLEASATGGTPGYTYSWTPRNGTGQLASGLGAGTHTVTVTDLNYCQVVKSITLTEPLRLQTVVQTTNVSCYGGTNGAAAATATGGVQPYYYSWSPRGGNAAVATGFAAGMYTVTTTDSHNCTSSANFTISEPTQLAISSTQTNVACNGGSTGSISAFVTGGTGAYDYNWSPRAGAGSTLNGLTAGSYTLIVSDENTCELYRHFTISEPSPAVITVGAVTNASCHGSADGSAAVSIFGGTPDYDYAWSPSGLATPSVAGLPAGTHTVTITDANACQYIRSLTVTEPTAIEIVPSQTDVSCPGGSDGTAIAVVSGGTGSYAYAWSPIGGTAPDASGLGAGAYTLTVTDDNACVRTHDYMLTEPPEAVITVDAITNATCHGSADGGASVSVTGGTPGYTYAWAPSGGAEPTLEEQAAGTYTVMVKDANACEYTRSLAIAEPEAIVVSLAASTPADCSDAPGGALTIAVSGGSAGYAYDWSPGEPMGDGTESISGLAVGAYAVHVEDMNGCAGEGTFEVVPASDIAPAATNTSATVAQDGSIALTLASTYAGCLDRVYRIVDGPEHGTLDGTPPEVVYTPAPGYFGPDAFTFEVKAGSETSAPALVSIAVTETPVGPENTIPTAHPMTVKTDVAMQVTLTLSGSDLDGDPLTYAIKGGPRLGTLSGTPPLVTYTPAGTGAYEDEFTFVVDDGEAISAPATVLVIVEDPTGPGEEPVGPGKGKPSARKNDGGGCSAVAKGDLFAALLLVAAFLGLRRRKTQAA